MSEIISETRAFRQKQPIRELPRRATNGLALVSGNASSFLSSWGVESRSIPDGLVRGVETSAQSTQLDMDDALKDLDALMVKAREMVRLAGELNDRLTTVAELDASSGGADLETATFIRSSLAQLGLRMTDVPVTLDMARDEKRWYEQLARELAGMLQGAGGKSGPGMMENRGIIALDEVWGGWNRARGVGKTCSLTSPLSKSRKITRVFVNSSLDALAISAGATPSTGLH